MSRAGTAIFAAMLATLIAGTGHGHEGHDHAPQPAVSADGSPRGEAASELFELVAIAKGMIGRPDSRASMIMPSPATRERLGTSAVSATLQPAWSVRTEVGSGGFSVRR